LEFEKERVQYDSSKADKDAFSLLKELPNNRVEIEIMKNKIAQAREETKGIINYTNDIERQIMEIQDELKKINVKITNSIKEKDKISSEINTIHKKCSTLRSKIDKAEKSANEFLYSVGQLAKLTQQNNI
jgi:chromosome segregation ATPase